MNISGENIILRAIEESDIHLLWELVNDEDTEYMLGGWSFPVSSQKQAEWISKLGEDLNTLRCIIETKKESIPIGTIILSDIDYKNGNAEIHLKISNNGYRGKGFGTDAIKTMVRYAFSELRLNCIYSKVSEHNEASKNLFKRCGFIQEGQLRNRLYKRGHFIDIAVFSILNE